MNGHKALLKFTGAIALVVMMAIAINASNRAEAASRIKDIVEFEGVRSNMLLGYGLVVGLNRTGDRLANSVFTQQRLVAMLERLGVNTRDTDINTQNVAAVMVTAVLPPFARHGTRIDVSISALGDATNLLGGTLLVTPLLGADGEVYAVAQGMLAVSGFTAQGQAGTTVTKGVPTAGRISNGGIVERELGFELDGMDEITIALRNPDFTTARRISDAINLRLGSNFAAPTDPGTVVMRVPQSYHGSAARPARHYWKSAMSHRPAYPARLRPAVQHHWRRRRSAQPGHGTNGNTSTQRNPNGWAVSYSCIWHLMSITVGLQHGAGTLRRLEPIIAVRCRPATVTHRVLTLEDLNSGCRLAGLRAQSGSGYVDQWFGTRDVGSTPRRTRLGARPDTICRPASRNGQLYPCGKTHDQCDGDLVAR